MELWKAGLVVCTFGNASSIDRKRGIIAIKPSGVSYSELTPDKIVLVDLNNRVVGGKYRPSSDTRSHIVLYKNFPGIGGVVHTHSAYATAWAQAKKPIPCFGTTHADYVHGNIPCTSDLSRKQIRADYEKETGIQIVKTFRRLNLSYKDTEMTIVASHGSFTWGKTPEDAVYNSIMLEEIAKIAYFTVGINPDARQIKRALLDKHFFRKHGKNAYYGQRQENRTKLQVGVVGLEIGKRHLEEYAKPKSHFGLTQMAAERKVHVLCGGKPLASGEDGVESMRICLAVKESIRKQKVIVL